MPKFIDLVALFIGGSSIHWLLPTWHSIQIASVVLAMGAFIAMLRFKVGMFTGDFRQCAAGYHLLPVIRRRSSNLNGLAGEVSIRPVSLNLKQFETQSKNSTMEDNYEKSSA